MPEKAKIFFISQNLRGAYVVYGSEGVKQYYGYTKVQKRCISKAAKRLLIGGNKMICKDCIHFVVCEEVPTKLADDCDFFKDQSRFVELPCELTKKRMTNDNPQENYDLVLNYAFANDRKVLLRYANDQENIDLCDYIAFHAKGTCGMSAQDVLDGACFECDDFSCSLGRAYISAVQAAELREKLKMYEDLSEQALKEREG